MRLTDSAQHKGTQKTLFRGLSIPYARFFGTRFLAILSAFIVTSFPIHAAAQSSNNAASSAKPTQALQLNLPRSDQMLIDTNAPFSSSNLVDLPLQSVGSSLFKLDASDTGCLTGGSSCFAKTDTIDLSNNKQYLRLNKKGLGIELSPRASLRFDDDHSSALVGALVKIGDDLKENADFDSNTWYFFAGADAEALTYKPGSFSSFTRGTFNLQDRVIVGDAQAGVGYRIGDADVSLAYMRREVSSFSSNDPSDDASYTEDAAALSFTWRR